MKKLLLLILLFSEYGYAQHNYAYLNTSIDLGNYFGGDFTASFVNKNNYSFSVGYLVQLYSPEQYPDDIDDHNDLPFTNISSTEHFFFSVGKVLRFKNSKRNRLNLSIGLARTKGDRSYDYVRGKKTDRGYLYDYSSETYRNYSLIINPKFEFAFFSFFGLHISPKLILNEKRTYYGLGLGYMLGKVR